MLAFIKVVTLTISYIKYLERKFFVERYCNYRSFFGNSFKIQTLEVPQNSFKREAYTN